MASQGLWSYNDALANFNRTNNPQALADMEARLRFSGEGGPALQPGEALPTHLSRTWNDILRDNAIQMYGPDAANWGPAQWEQIARTQGILGGIENTPGEIFKDGMNNGLGLLLTMVGGMAMQGAGGASSMGAEYAGGGEVGSGYAASAPGSSGTVTGGGDIFGGGPGGVSPGDSSWFSNVPSDSVMAPGGSDTLGSYSIPEGTYLTGAESTPWYVPTSNVPVGSVLAGSGSVLGGGLSGGGGGGLGDIFSSGSVLGGVGSLLGKLNGGMKDIFGEDWGAKAAGSIPILAAIDYAKGQAPFDTSRLESTYDQFEPAALAYEYDQNTARGRNSLTSSLQNRGVMGSSFGNNDLTNFQTSRDLGRRSLVNQGLAARGGLASSILDAQVKERALKNDLYGRSLLALGNVLGGRR